MDKSYLITGAAGFIGARFVESCAQRDIATISVDHEAYFESRFHGSGFPFGTIVDRERLFDWLEKERPRLSAIVHLGACTDTTELDEVYLRQVNLEYSQRLWTYASGNGIPFVYASSAATYGDGRLGYGDDESLIPKLKALNPYGESKRLFDLWALEEEKAGRHPSHWAGFKFFNVYGSSECHKGKMASVVLHAFDQIQARGSVRLFRSHRPGIADGEQQRDFIFIEDVVDVLHFALNRPLARGIYNLGSGKARSFLDLANAVFASLNTPPRIEFIDTPVEIRERYQYFTEARMEKLRAEGYSRPFTSLEDGVKKYIQELQSRKP